MCWLTCGLCNQEMPINQIMKKIHIHTHTHTQILNYDFVPKEKIGMQWQFNMFIDWEEGAQEKPQ